MPPTKPLPTGAFKPTGATPTSRAKLCAATPHTVRGTTPAQFLTLPSQLSYWLNNQYGDCVTAEEAFAKACAGILISDDTVRAWAEQHFVMNGATLDSVLTMMVTDGFRQDGNVYNDGPAHTVDWTNPAVLQNAISQGPVKIGVAAAQLQGVPGIGQQSGWHATGFQRDDNEDHCVSLCGYGPAAWLRDKLTPGSTPDAHLAPTTQPAYALFTWNTVGVIEYPSLLAITGEAWLRTPNEITMGTNPVPPDPVTIQSFADIPVSLTYAQIEAIVAAVMALLKQFFPAADAGAIQTYLTTALTSK